MKKLVFFIFLSAYFFFFSSCGKEEQYNDSGARVNFKINLQGSDSSLRDPYSYKIYSTSQGYKNGDIYNGEYIYLGKSGLFIFNNDQEGNIPPTILAFDLCCPYENNPSITITPNSSFRAVCSTCKTEYNLIEGGRPVSGPSDKRLFQYRVFPETPYNGIFRIHN